MAQRHAAARDRIINAFRVQVLSRRYDEITVAQLIKAAGVARSTFYDHFDDKRALLLVSMAPLLDVLVACARGAADRAAVEQLVAHFWDNRSTGRVVLGPSARQAMCDAIVEKLIGTDLGELERTALAHGYLGTIHRWLIGELSATQDEMVNWLLRVPR